MPAGHQGSSFHYTTTRVEFLRNRAEDYEVIGMSSPTGVGIVGWPFARHLNVECVCEVKVNFRPRVHACALSEAQTMLPTVHSCNILSIGRTNASGKRFVYFQLRETTLIFALIFQFYRTDLALRFNQMSFSFEELRVLFFIAAVF